MPNENFAGTAPFTTAIGVPVASRKGAGAARSGADRGADDARVAPKRETISRRRPALRESLLLLLVVVLVVAAIAIGRSGRFTAGSDLGYWIGVAGGVAMLLLFLYPLRKRWRRLRNAGSTRMWFRLHMMLGIAGPVLIIVHSTLRFGSLNATVAFTAMALVAASGIVGRLLYSRIHHGLYGRRATLGELRAQAGFDTEAVRSKLAFAPTVEARLDEFARLATAAGLDGLNHPLQFMALGWHAKMARWSCTRDAVAALRRCSDDERWSRRKLERRIRSRKALIATYLRAVQRVAQFGVFERLFSWWHVLHVPLVYMMVLAAVAHVIAVHMY